MLNNTTAGLGAQVRLLEGFGLTLVLLVSLMLNLAVCAIIWRTKLLRSKPANTFVANLCIANLLLTACVIPFSLATVIHDEHGVYPRSLCQVTEAFVVIYEEMRSLYALFWALRLWRGMIARRGNREVKLQRRKAELTLFLLVTAAYNFLFLSCPNLPFPQPTSLEQLPWCCCCMFCEV